MCQWGYWYSPMAETDLNKDKVRIRWYDEEDIERHAPPLGRGARTRSTQISPVRIRMAERARSIISDLYKAYVGNPRLLPAHFRNLLASEPVYKVVADYIAGMTDRFAAAEHGKITGSDLPA